MKESTKESFSEDILLVLGSILLALFISLAGVYIVPNLPKSSQGWFSLTIISSGVYIIYRQLKEVGVFE